MYLQGKFKRGKTASWSSDIVIRSEERRMLVVCRFQCRALWRILQIDCQPPPIFDRHQGYESVRSCLLDLSDREKEQDYFDTSNPWHDPPCRGTFHEQVVSKLCFFIGTIRELILFGRFCAIAGWRGVEKGQRYQICSVRFGSHFVCRGWWWSLWFITTLRGLDVVLESTLGKAAVGYYSGTLMYANLYQNKKFQKSSTMCI